MSSIDCRVLSIFAYFANTARLCTNVSRLLSFNYKIVVYFCWCFRAYAMTNCVFSMSSKSCKTWIRRWFCAFDESNECSICFIFVFRSTKLLVTNKSIKRNVTRKNFCVEKRCSVRHYCSESWSFIKLSDFYLSHYLFWFRIVMKFVDCFIIFSTISHIVWKVFFSIVRTCSHWSDFAIKSMFSSTHFNSNNQKFHRSRTFFFFDQSRSCFV